MQDYCLAFQRYSDFEGRSRRKEYWSFMLYNALIFSLSFFLDTILSRTDSFLGLGVFSMLYLMAALVPGIAVSIRRLHDSGKSGWNMLLGLVPIIGAIILLVFFLTDSQRGKNQYGLNPKEHMEEEFVLKISETRAF